MRVVVVEDNAITGLWLATAVEVAGHVALGPFASIEEVQAIEDDEAPEAALLDLRLGHGRCGATIDAYLAERFGTVSVYVTASADFAHRYRRTAIGFVEKPLSNRDLAEVLAYVEARRAGRTDVVPPSRLELFGNAEAERHLRQAGAL